MSYHAAMNVQGGAAMPAPGSHSGIIRFGPFEVDTANRELRKRGSVVKLQPQQFAVLLLLVERAGQVVSREAIHQHIWGNDTFVDFERGINFSINQIRAALGDSAEKPRFVETIPRRGYRFIGKIEADEPGETGSVASVSTGQSEKGDRGTDHQPPRPFLSKQRILIGCVVLFLVSGALLVLLRTWHSGAASAGMHVPATNIRTIPLTTLRGQISGQTFSPDGRQIAFTLNSPNLGKEDIYVQLIEGGGRPVQITHTESGISPNLDWSPDGRIIVYGRCWEDNRGALYTIPALGGPEKKLTDVACFYGNTAGNWTPDGKSVLFSDTCTPGGSLGIMVFTLSTGVKRCVTAPDSKTTEFARPLVSPDGDMVAFVGNSGANVQDLYVVPLRGGTPRRLTFEAKHAEPTLWSQDGQDIVFYSDRSGISGNELWRISAKGGAIRPETFYPHEGVVSRDGKRLAYVEDGGAGSSIWSVSLSPPRGKVLSQKKIIDSHTSDEAPQLSPDGKQIVFRSRSSGAGNTWRSNADGSNAIQLTSFGGELSGSPRWSPDGKWIAFDRRPNDHAEIGVIDAEGGNMRAITEGAYDNNVPTWSRDGKSIYFSSNRSGEWQIWKHDLSSGAEVQVTQHGGMSAFESYDGRDLYYVKFRSPGIWRMPISGGDEQKVTDQPSPWYWGYWDVAETGLYFMDTETSLHPTIAFYDFKSRKTRPLFQLDGQPVWTDPGLSASRDGRTILYSEHDVNSTIKIIENFE
jgi:Tol biopolymer transport system component/DNA-binding winged helix-turn-helix (wHTH) protein